MSEIENLRGQIIAHVLRAAFSEKSPREWVISYIENSAMLEQLGKAVPLGDPIRDEEFLSAVTTAAQAVADAANLRTAERDDGALTAETDDLFSRAMARLEGAMDARAEARKASGGYPSSRVCPG